MLQQTKRLLKQFSFRMQIVLGIMVIALALFGLLIHEVIIEKEQRIDLELISWITAQQTAALTAMMKVFTYLGSRPFFLYPSYVLITCWLWSSKNKKALALNFALTGFIGFILIFLLKFFFVRPRREDHLLEALLDSSFPSGHTTSAFIFYGLLIYLTWLSGLGRGWKWLLSLVFGLIAIMVGISRIYLGMHYPSDVLAGAIIGSVWVVFCLIVFERLR